MRDLLYGGKWLEFGRDNAENHGLEHAPDPCGRKNLGGLHQASKADGEYLLLVGPWADVEAGWWMTFIFSSRSRKIQIHSMFR